MLLSRTGLGQLPKEGENWLTFEELAAKARGDRKLGILKLDVDNLGVIFAFGLEDNKTISRITSLSRMMSLYFEGCINQIIEDMGLADSIYLVFSGGDDTFLIGAWDQVLEFAAEFRKKFGEYVCHNKKLTFSCGVGIFAYDYPVIRSIALTEASLDQAKDYVYPDESQASKDKISLLGQVFNKEIYRHYRTDFADRIIQEYREIVLHNLMGKNQEANIRNIMIIPVAIKLAEMATRQRGGMLDERKDSAKDR